jgi:hypothetical protein
MANWYSLAPELHDMILSVFLQDVIYEYCVYNKKDIYNSASIDALVPEWPKAPEPLRNYSSALRTCRSFYNCLNRVILNGGTVRLRLQSAQVYKCLAITDDVVNNSEWPYGVVGVGVFMKMAGVFWKNPLIMDHAPNPILRIMEALDEMSLLMLVPHLEKWVLRHRQPWPAQHHFVICKLDSRGVIQKYEPDQVAIFHPGSSILTALGWSYVCSVTKLYEGSEHAELAESIIEERRNHTTRGYAMIQQQANRQLLEICPALRELGRASGEWWLFSVHTQPDKKWWILVNYEEKLMWGNMCEPELCVWDDVWDPKSWRVGNYDTFGLGWLLCEDMEDD